MSAVPETELTQGANPARPAESLEQRLDRVEVELRRVKSRLAVLTILVVAGSLAAD